MAVITPQEAAAALQQYRQQLDPARYLPPTLNRIRVLMHAEAFPICNVGPWPYRLERGPLTLDLPAYDPANDPAKLGYAKSALLDGIRREAIIADENKYTYIEDDGHAVANDLVGVGFGMHPSNSLLKYGVFVPAGLLPTAEEIAQAKRRLSDYYDELIAEARDAYDLGPKERAATIKDRHIMAARIRGIDEKWVHHAHAEESVRCSMCGKFNPAGVAKCQCGTILDFDLFVKIEDEQKRKLEQYEERRTRPGPLKPSTGPARP